MPSLYISRMSRHPPHLKIQRAKVIVDDDGQKFLTTCDSCRKEKYIIRKLCVALIEQPP